MRGENANERTNESTPSSFQSNDRLYLFVFIVKLNSQKSSRISLYRLYNSDERKKDEGKTNFGSEIQYINVYSNLVKKFL